MAFGETTAVSGDMTVYAQWAYKQFAITVNLDAGDGAFNQAEFTLYKSGGTGSKLVSITGSGYAGPRWEVDGDFKGTGTSITINAGEYGVGKHILTLFVRKNGVTWSKEIVFIISIN
jgi:hypothetical protein